MCFIIVSFIGRYYFVRCRFFSVNIRFSYNTFLFGGLYCRRNTGGHERCTGGSRAVHGRVSGFAVVVVVVGRRGSRLNVRFIVRHSKRSVYNTK